MTEAKATALPLALPERCCQPGQCAYTPGRVRTILLVMRVADELGEDPGELAATILASKGEGRSPGASAGSDADRYATLVADVQQAISKLGGRPSAEAISDRLCLYGNMDDYEA
ncbi:MAG: hypothetical protein IT306_14715 [Chloroflexi bacterium]|nr:hypothetical protein [Chloroflexota bacterium]